MFGFPNILGSYDISLNIFLVYTDWDGVRAEGLGGGGGGAKFGLYKKIYNKKLQYFGH